MQQHETGTGTRRLASLDALRGFDMFWIMGGDTLAAAIGGLGNSPLTRGIARQLEHAEWEGFHFYDLVFPLFVFVMGVSIVFSLARTLDEHGPAATLRRVLARSVLLFALGIFYSGGFTNPWPDVRLLGVLNRIALCYLGAAAIFCALRGRRRAAATTAGIAAALLVGYWALMTFVPYPDLRPLDASGAPIHNPSAGDPAAGERLVAESTAELRWDTTSTLTGVIGPGLNLANYVDARFLPGKLWVKTWDPEGLLSTLPAIASALLGVLAGMLLANRALTEARKVRVLAVAGLLGVALGAAWGLEFPVIKKIWTSSFALVAGGASALLLALFHHAIEVRGRRAWAEPFVWYGTNAITVYMADNLIGFRKLAGRLVGPDARAFLDAHVAVGSGGLVLALTEIGCGLALVWYLHRKRIFLRL